MDQPISFWELINTEFPPNRDWISTGILPRGGSMILAGESKTGKSFFCLSACRALALGEPFLGHPKMPVPEPARVLYIEDEVKERGAKERIVTVFSDVDPRRLQENLFVLSNKEDLRLDKPEGFTILKDAVEKIQPQVLIMDPIGRFIGSLDENKNDAMGQVLDALERLLRKHQAREMSLILSHHSRKPANVEGFDPLDPHNMRGSSRFFANPDTILMLDRIAKTTKDNEAGNKTWQIRGRFELRQAAGFADDLVFSINRDNDLRVKYEKSGAANKAPELKDDLKKKVLKPEQLRLPEA